MHKHIQRAFRGISHAPEHVGVDHGSFDALMPEQFLHLANVHAIKQKVCCETVAERMHCNALPAEAFFGVLLALITLIGEIRIFTYYRHFTK
jgi:hypothetical protein